MPDAGRRDPEAHRAILDAAWALTTAGGWTAVSVDAIAARAGVGKRTVYRWWPGKAAVVLEAFLDHARATPVTTRATTVEGLLRAHARHFVDLYVNTELGRVFTGLFGAAQQDPDLAARLDEHWFEPRRAPVRAAARELVRDDADVDLLLDLVFAPLHYRLLTGRRPLDHAYADAVLTAALTGVLG
ncbi:TetR/AcrR family transcriptional regulator [Amycolatopsis rhabdoformis]|uniref:TetR/AcrR family transcriptional regulator n=1 Tax=Amycolatopsis rhabdoformis TaxID=1448059 RepID=A0ABZ1IHQ8_9PSEU|nr:TetR/AcrR family transcriptional regulator [Amycolatopsis rhabdoformis]WSE33311.1 TetR/AcrR family transcriptional regulator [Amycolatopsis rhabdoformis]